MVEYGLIIALIAIYFLGGFERISLFDKWKELPLVKRFPILE